MTTIRPFVVNLLVALVKDRSGRLVHPGGPRATPSEIRLVMSATSEEKQAATARLLEKLDELQEQLADEQRLEYLTTRVIDLERMRELCTPYWQSHGEHVPANEIPPLMSNRVDAAELAAIVFRLYGATAV